MTASLYQSGSSTRPTAMSAVARAASVSAFIRGCANSALHEVIEIAFAMVLRAQTQHVRRADVRIEHHEVARAVPHEARVGDQIMHLIRLLRLQPERRQVELDPAALCVLG